MPRAESWVWLRNHLPPVTNTSAWVGRSAPPDSTKLIMGRRFSRAMSCARSVLATECGLDEPPREVGSRARQHAFDRRDDADTSHTVGPGGEAGPDGSQ